MAPAGEILPKYRIEETALFILLRETSRDWVLVCIIALMALGANLPHAYTDYLNIDQRYFLAGLIGVVAVALVRYLKLSLLLAVVFLAIGANLPKNIADEFGIDPQILLLVLIVMVVVSLGNRLFKLPVGTETTKPLSTVHGVAALFNAVLKGRMTVVKSLLVQGVNVNGQTISGKTPLMAAAYKGYSDVVQILLSNGANADAEDKSGDTAIKMATRNGFTRTVELLRHAGMATN